MFLISPASIADRILRSTRDYQTAATYIRLNDQGKYYIDRVLKSFAAERGGYPGVCLAEGRKIYEDYKGF